MSHSSKGKEKMLNQNLLDLLLLHPSLYLALAWQGLDSDQLCSLHLHVILLNLIDPHAYFAWSLLLNKDVPHSSIRHIRNDSSSYEIRPKVFNSLHRSISMLFYDGLVKFNILQWLAKKGNRMFVPISIFLKQNNNNGVEERKREQFKRL